LLTGSGKNYNGVALRIIATCLILAAASGVLAPSSQELHNRYGEPYLESFLARPGIGLTVEYGSDHSACGGLIEPAHPLFHPEESLPLMSPDTVTEILEEVVPVSHRRRNVRRASRSRTPGTSAENPNSVNEILVPGDRSLRAVTSPDKSGGLNGSTQHEVEVYLQGSQQLKVVRERWINGARPV